MLSVEVVGKMSKNMDLMLDECIDRINSGESIEECLAHYPEHAAELRPLLLALSDAGDVCSDMPKAEARSMMRQRLESAATTAERSPHKNQRISAIFGWPKIWATATIVVVLALVGFGLYQMLTPDMAPVIAQANFRLLLSDEPNAIGDFGSLKVTISRIGVLRGGENGGWDEIKIEPAAVVDLTRLQGLNAQEIWKGNLPEGQYRQVFIYIENAVGILTNGTTAKVVVPSGNLQISKPFAVTADGSTISFVYDVTVVAAGSDYILQPQLEQSGATEKIHELGSGELTIQVIEGKVTPGESITIRVTSGMTPVGDASVVVNDRKVGTTDENGLKVFTISSNDELEIAVLKDQAKGELEIDLERESEEQEAEDDELIIKVVSGDVLPGKSITILVTANGNPLAGALVIVDDREIGTTVPDGRISFVLADVEELDIKAVKGEMEGELKIDLKNKSEH
jgi:hypothetical protein